MPRGRKKKEEPKAVEPKDVTYVVEDGISNITVLSDPEWYVQNSHASYHFIKTGHGLLNINSITCIIPGQRRVMADGGLNYTISQDEMDLLVSLVEVHQVEVHQVEVHHV